MVIVKSRGYSHVLLAACVAGGSLVLVACRQISYLIETFDANSKDPN